MAYQIIKNAVEKFGYKNPAIALGKRQGNVISVFLGKKYFGIYDFSKNTFID